MRVALSCLGLTWFELPAISRRKHSGFLVSFPRCGVEGGDKVERCLKAVSSQSSEMESDFITIGSQ